MSQLKDNIYSKIPKRYQVKKSTYLKALLDAIAEGDEYIEAQVEAVRDNSVVVTAIGRHLDRMAGLYGVVRGQGTGVMDEDFQKIVPLLGMSPKQITHIMLALIDVIYGPYSTHANLTSANYAPFTLLAGDSLRFIVEGESIEITFGTEDAVNLLTATASEVSTAISKKTGGKIIGSVVTDARTGNQYVNARTSTIGSEGFIQCIGGDAQNKIRFPSIRPINEGVSTWDVTRSPDFVDGMVYTWTAGVAPGLKAANVQRGDYVSIRSDSSFDLYNTGNFEVLAVDSSAFTVRNGEGRIQSAITTLHSDDFVFFDPKLGNILLASRPAAIVETSAGQLTVIMPVTSPIVKRTLKGGHHLHGGNTFADSATANSITIGNTSGFNTSGMFKPTRYRGNSIGTISTVLGSTVTLIDANQWPTIGSFYCNVTRTYYQYSNLVGNVLSGVQPAPIADMAGSPVSYCPYWSYAGITGQTLTGVYPNPTGLANQEITTVGTQSNYPGSFVYDPAAAYTCSKEASYLLEDVSQGSNRTLVQMANVSGFNDTGFVVFEFGQNNVEGPIRYLTKVGTGGLILDAGHTFESDHLKGTSIRMIRQMGPYTPRTLGEDLPVYITSTSPARDLLISYLRSIAASGVQIRFVINVPEQKWESLPNLYTTDPRSTTLP